MYPVELTGLFVNDVYFHEPGSCITNVFILLFSIYLVATMRHLKGKWALRWKLFLASLGIAAFGGIFTHGFPLIFSENGFFWAWGLKNTFVPIGNYFASMALVTTLLSKQQVDAKKLLQWRTVFAVKGAAVVLAMFYSYSFVPVVLDLALTYFFAIFATQHLYRSLEGAKWLFAGFLIAALSGFLYLFPWAIHAHWLTNADAVHLFVLVSMWCVYKGVAVSSPVLSEQVSALRESH